ncbi:protein PFC0760c-like [Aphidius gifuensis]|uniref:protein PFC0760c-like n=1 Tax=Aphidius gifuensis TaxID=684658 RepID=UPI001CDCBFB4|nr:protein PFC0760c-like [Aphidius gifuensis]
MSSMDNVNMKIDDWWLIPNNEEERKLEVTRSVTIKKYPAPKIINIKTIEIVNIHSIKKQKINYSIFKKPKPYVIAKRKFLCEFYQRPVLQRINNLPTTSNNNANNLIKDKKLDYKNDRIKICKGFVKSIVDRFSTNNNADDIKNNTIRKRTYGLGDNHQSPVNDHQSKIQRLIEPIIESNEELESPRLVEAFINTSSYKKTKIYDNTSSDDDFSDFKMLPQTPDDTFVIDTNNDELKISSSSDHTMTHSSDMITVKENIENINNKLSKIHDDKHDDDCLNDTVVVMNDSPEKNSSISNENNDQLMMKTIKIEEDSIVDEKEENISISNENNDQLMMKTIKIEENSVVDEQEELIVDIKTEINDEEVDVKEENENELITDIKTEITEEINSSFDNINWLDDSFDKMEKSFPAEIPDNQYWRFSSPIQQIYNREDSVSEVINSMNENLTPSKVIFSNKLRETNNSSKYYLDSNQMSLIYSLTPTANDDDDIDYDNIDDNNLTKEHFNCGRENCSGCLITSISNNHNFSNENIDNDYSDYLWDDIIKSNDNSTNDVINLNKTIDLFDNSIQSNTTNESGDINIDINLSNNNNIEYKNEPISPTDSIENDRCSTGGCSLFGSDLLELPHATFLEIQQSNDHVFHNDIVNSANEIIAGIDEREKIVKAESIVQSIVNNIESLNINSVETIVVENNSTVDDENFNNKTFDIDDDTDVIIVEEIIHHIIDKNDIINTKILTSMESIDLKKMKENTNAELKELSTNENNNNLNNLFDKDEENLSIDNEEIQEQDSGLATSPDDFINEVKLIVDDATNENAMRENLETIVSSCNEVEIIENFKNDNDKFKHYTNQMKIIANTSDINILDVSVIEGNLSTPTDTNLETCSESVKQFINRFKKIIDGDNCSNDNSLCQNLPSEENNNSNESNNTERSMEEISSSIEINLSVEKSVIAIEDSLDNETTNEQISSGDTDTKSDNSNEKINSTFKTFCMIQYETTNNQIDDNNNDNTVELYDDQDSMETSISSVKEDKLITLWDLNENERECNWNKIRSNEGIPSFINYEKIDDDVTLERTISIDDLNSKNFDDKSFKKQVQQDDSNDILYELIERKDSLEPIPEMNEDVADESMEDTENIDHSLEPIIEADEGTTNESSNDDIEDVRINSTSEFLSCNDDTTMYFETGNDSVANTLSPDGCYASCQTTNTGTQTVQSLKSESDDDQSSYDSLEKLSALKDKKYTLNFDDACDALNNINNSIKKCSNCKKLLTENTVDDSNENLINNVVVDDDDDQPIICSSCTMILSLDTQEFIRIESIVKSEEDIKLSYDNSLIKIDIPKYEDTSLYRIVSTCSFTDNMSTCSTSFDESFDLDEIICSIKMLFN